jgi:hypothetical protein
MSTREQSTARRVIVFGLLARASPYVSEQVSLSPPRVNIARLGALEAWFKKMH